MITLAMVQKATDKRLRPACERVGLVPPWSPAAWVVVYTGDPATYQLLWRGRNYTKPVPVLPRGILGPTLRDALYNIRIATLALQAVPLDSRDAKAERESLTVSIALTTPRPDHLSPGELLTQVVEHVNRISPDLQFSGRPIA